MIRIGIGTLNVLLKFSDIMVVRRETEKSSTMRYPIEEDHSDKGVWQEQFVIFKHLQK